MKATSIWQTIRHEVLKKAWRNRTNEPFLSGDVFATNADVSLFSKDYSHSDLSNAQVIFCPSDRLEDAQDQYSSFLKNRILILGNGDRDFSDADQLLGIGARHVFAQNLCVNNPGLTCLPIGIENIRLARNGMPKLFPNIGEVEPKEFRLLVGPFSPTHPEREVLLRQSQLVGNDPFYQLTSSLVNPKEYARLSSSALLVAAPRGNGIDTHRFWEAMYRGAWPVVRDSIWARNLRMHNLPFLVIESWSSGSLESLKSVNVENFMPKAIEALWWPYWQNLIRSLI